MSNLIRSLCEKYTNLTKNDIDLIVQKSENLCSLASQTDQDIFIDCPCKKETEAVVVAEVLRENSLYQLSTLGCIVREVDEPAVFRTFRTGEETEEVEAKVFSSRLDGKVIQNVQPIKNEGRTIGVLIFERAATEETDLKREEKKNPTYSFSLLPALKESVWVTEYFDEALILVSENGVVLYRNPKAEDIYRDQGFLEDILGQEYSRVSLHGELIAPESEPLEKEMKIGGFYYRLRQIYCKEHGVYLILIRDITKLRQTEERVELETTAMQETTHRIKNNLQTIHSLLRLEWRRAKSEETKIVLSDVMNRIMSISATYENLLRSDRDEISLFGVIKEIKDNFIRLMDNEEQQIDIRVTGDDLFIPSDYSSSVALVVNELIQNAFKYAFKDRKSGEINIAVSEGNMGYANIIVTDNGIGYNQNSEKKSLGLKIIENLVENKLKGRLEIQSSSEGTRVMFDFKIKS